MLLQVLILDQVQSLHPEMGLSISVPVLILAPLKGVPVASPPTPPLGQWEALLGLFPRHPSGGVSPQMTV